MQFQCGMTQRKCVYQIVSNVYRFGVLIELNLNKVHRRSVLADVGMHENARIQYGGKLDLPQKYLC